MTAWPPWDRAVAPADLARYVQRGAVPRLLPAELARDLPGPGEPDLLARVRRAYEVFARRGIAYVDEPTTSGPAGQVVRPLDQVLATPRQGTCLDLAVAFAGACLDAGLHPLIVIADSARRGRPAHAVVVVWLGGGWAGRPAAGYPLTGAVHDRPPADLVGDVRAGPDAPGSFVAVDVARAAVRRDRAGQSRAGQPEAGHGAPAGPATWAEAVAAGAALLAGAPANDLAATPATGLAAGLAAAAGPGWRWAVAVDVGVAYDEGRVLPLLAWPDHDILSPGYLDAEPDAGPLAQVQARRNVVPFYGRDELDVLLEWCQAPDPESRVRVAIVHGVGGAGKTHLAAELCDWLAADGWYAGFLERDPDPAHLAWLGEIVQPLLVVVDYAEANKSADVTNLLRAVRGRTTPTCLLLTARAIGPWWTNDIEADLRRAAHQPVVRPLPLPAAHPRATGVFRAALRAFGGEPGARPEPVAWDWTTLDLVMLAWLAARGADDLPQRREDLYREVLAHELRYWGDRCDRRYRWRPTEAVLRSSGACVSLRGPVPDRVMEALKAVPGSARTAAASWPSCCPTCCRPIPATTPSPSAPTPLVTILSCGSSTASGWCSPSACGTPRPASSSGPAGPCPAPPSRTGR
ncbi:MAG TPA: hypothetical protein VLJ59_11500 [Mycobacteriales bacterium]|nr:hypothetical protein [Mycobacteriales bacterium]